MRAMGIAVLAGAALLATSMAKTDQNDKLRSIGMGRAVYLTKCVSCHGTDAKGAAKDLGTRSHGEVAVPDLTTLEARDGRFDAIHVARHVGGNNKGWWDPCTTGMACWEHILSQESGAAVARLQIYNVVNYLRSVQERPLGEQTPPK